MSYKKLLTLILILCMAIAAMPLPVFADSEAIYTPAAKIIDLEEGSFIRLTDEERVKIASGVYSAEKPQLVSLSEGKDDNAVFDDPDEALVYLRAHMALREGEVTIGYNVGQDLSQELLDAIVNYTFIGFFDHTGIGNQGDYFLYHVYQGGISGFDYDHDKGIMYLTYAFSFYTDAEQERTAGEEIAAVLEDLDLVGKNAYERFSAIYEYITHNIVYDYDNLEDDDYLLKYTAYAAIVDNQAVCQGYANLLYRMLLEAGVDCRIISGLGGGGGHAWNIVGLGDYYYNVDSTWDAAGIDIYDWDGNFMYKEYPMTYRLRCNANFPDHERDADYDSEEFNLVYPMSDKDFDPDDLPPEAEDITVKDCSGGKAEVISDGNTLTVKSDVPCKVGYKSGDRYIAVSAQPNGDGSYSFICPEGAGEAVVVVKGDATGDGEVNLGDATRIKAVFRKKTTLTGIAAFAADITGDGEVNLGDATRITALFRKKTTVSW